MLCNGNKLFLLQTFRHPDNFIRPALPYDSVQFGNSIAANHGRPFFRFLIGMVNTPHRVPGRQHLIIIHFRIVDHKPLIKGDQFKSGKMFRAGQERLKEWFTDPAQFISEQRFRLRRHFNHGQNIFPQIRVLPGPVNGFLPVHREKHYGMLFGYDTMHSVFQLFQLFLIQRIFRHGTVQGTAQGIADLQFRIREQFFHCHITDKSNAADKGTHTLYRIHRDKINFPVFCDFILKTVFLSVKNSYSNRRVIIIFKCLT